MPFFKSLTVRTMLGTTLVLCIGFAVLLAISDRMVRERLESTFTSNGALFTQFLAQQINTGTRLKRGAMIAPQIDSALRTDGLNLAGVRVTHAEGVEVLGEVQEGNTTTILDDLPEPYFSEEVKLADTGEYLMVHAPIILGTGADAVLVGEIVTVFDRTAIANETAGFRQFLTTSFAGMGVIVAVSLCSMLYLIVGRPLRQITTALQNSGDPEATIKLPKSSTREISEMSTAVGEYTASAAAQNALINELEVVLQSARNGDIQNRLREADATQKQDLRRMVNALLESIDSGLTETMRVLSQFAKKDLSAEMQGHFAGAFEQLQSDTNAMSSTLRLAIRDIGNNAADVKQQASDLAGAAVSLSDRSQQDAASIEETSAAIALFSDGLQTSAASAAEAKDHTEAAGQQAARGKAVIDDVVEAMERINAFSDDISDIISLIDDVAFQTNLLALNAGVEAARAGDHGLGFAVVASEVRALAGRASESALQISQLIANSSEEVQKGVVQVQRAGETMNEIVSSIAQVTDRVSDISTRSHDQAQYVVEMRATIDEISENTQRNAMMVDQTTSTTRTMLDATEQMIATIGVFKVSDRASFARNPSKATNPKAMAASKVDRMAS